MPSPTGTPLRVVGVLAGLAVAAAATVGVVYLVRDGAPGTGAIPGPGTGSPSLSPSASSSAAEAGPSPSPTTPEELKAKNIAEAKQQIVRYYEAIAAVSNAGFGDWEANLSPFWGHPTIARSMSQTYASFAESGYYTSGQAVVQTMTVTDYSPDDSGFESVGLDVCVDFGAVQTFGRDGVEKPRDAATPTRYVLSYLMRHQGPETEWTVNDEQRHVEQPC
ncbi:hypothetical protein L1785_05375 [Antribacter sp. KLBMP9083]|uniref:Uncharacterized protein n=1 Tax=Antribacter soli TaxID=2910976 RepID=A0AA41UAR9_9MICO|nr:hypothetical protein [Antribacter soli]MCF4120404.1 hypothetical protein [Antribacter soli]